MSKLVLLAAAAVVGIGTVATAYYMTPIEVAASETPSILVDAAPAEVVRTIRTISMEKYLVHAGADTERALEAAQVYVSLSDPRAISKTETAFDLMRGDDHLMQFVITVKPALNGQSEVDVQTLIGDSKLASNPALHPYDIKLALSAADFLATDYVSSILKGHPMLMGERLEKEMARKYALEGDTAFASMERMQKTFWMTYTPDLIRESDGYAASAAEVMAEASDSLDADTPIGPSNVAEFAARDADEALEDHGEDGGW